MRFVIMAALAVAPLAAQQYPDAAVLTKQAAESVLKLHSLQYKEDVTMETAVAGQDIKMTTETTRAMLNPGKTRFETHAQGLTMIIVSDGETTWTYNSMGNEYTKKSAGMGPDGVMAAMGLGNMMPDMADMHLAQKTVGDETITIDGQKHDCWIVQTDIGAMEIPGATGGRLTGGKLTSWIDKKMLFELQTEATMNVSVAGGISTETHIKTVKKDLQIDGPIPDATFAFTPPEGAKEVEKMSLFGGVGSAADLEGQPAADFNVKSLEGKQFRLADLKGKPLLLDFWASWCGPCKQSMPVVEKIAREYKDQLTVLGVNAAEEREVVAEFLKRNPMGYPSALSSDTMLKDYKVDSLPTFVLIGSNGKIAAYQSGYGGEEMLRAMLQKAGLGKK